MSQKIGASINRLLGDEVGTIRKRAEGRISIALAYPNTYSVGMSNLGFQVIYGRLNRRDEVVCERAFLPSSDDIALHRKTRTLLLSCESLRPLDTFDMIAFSIPFENDVLNVLEMLDLAGIPLSSVERSHHHPLVIAGGIVPSLNPEPFAEFFDALCIGEGETMADELAAALIECRGEGFDRQALLRFLAQTPGVYVPSGYEVAYDETGVIQEVRAQRGFPVRIARRCEIDLDAIETGACVTAPGAEFGDMSLVELMRGCPGGCRFCAAGFVHLPPRWRSHEVLAPAIREAAGRADRVGLIGSDITSHQSLEAILDSVRDAGVAPSPASLRLDGLTPALLEALGAGIRQTVTIAPEAGTDRLRRVINKRIDTEQIIQAALLLSSLGISTLKLYFLVGLPTEAKEDVDGIVDTTRKILHHAVKASRHGRGPRVTLSINPFVPKAFTPFQWHPFEEAAVQKGKIQSIKRALKSVRGVSIIHEIPKWSAIQALLARGDRRTGTLAVTAYRMGGDWRAAAREINLNFEFYTTRPRPRAEVLPWEIIDHPIRKDYLWDEYMKALEGKHTPACHPPECRRCGVC